MNDHLSLDTVQAAIAEAWEMWKAQKGFGGFAIEVGDDEVEVSHRLRGKSHEFTLPPDNTLRRGQLRALKEWWETEHYGATLLPIQQKTPGQFGANAYYRAPKSGSIFNFEVPIRGR